GAQRLRRPPALRAAALRREPRLHRRCGGADAVRGGPARPDAGARRARGRRVVLRPDGGVRQVRRARRRPRVGLAVAEGRHPAVPPHRGGRAPRRDRPGPVPREAAGVREAANAVPPPLQPVPDAAAASGLSLTARRCSRRSPSGLATRARPHYSHEVTNMRRIGALVLDAATVAAAGLLLWWLTAAAHDVLLGASAVALSAVAWSRRAREIGREGRASTALAGILAMLVASAIFPGDFPAPLLAGALVAGSAAVVVARVPNRGVWGWARSAMGAGLMLPLPAVLPEGLSIVVALCVLASAYARYPRRRSLISAYLAVLALFAAAIYVGAMTAGDVGGLLAFFGVPAAGMVFCAAAAVAVLAV